MALIIIDSYSETNQDTDSYQRDYHPSNEDYDSARGQSFTCSLSNMRIVEAKFYLKKQGSPAGNAHAVLYAHTGTYGTSSLPTGSPLATSDDFDVTTLTTSYQLITFYFTGVQRYVMQNSTYYCITYENPATGNIDSNDDVIVGIDISSPAHSGNSYRYRNSAWGVMASDACFYVYGESAGTTMILTGNATLSGNLTCK